MRRDRQIAAFSLTELLVVMAVLLILMSLILIGSGTAYDEAMLLRCQHRLEQLGKACQMFTTKHDGQSLAYYNTQNYQRWYDTLVEEKYVDGRDVLGCPAETSSFTGGTTETEASSESELPVLLYNTSTGRESNNQWAWWATFVSFRAWLYDNIEYGFICVQAEDDGLVYLTASALNASSQVWFLNTEHYEYKQGQVVLEPAEMAAIRDFHLRGGGIQCWSESYRREDYYRSNNDIINVCENVGLLADGIAFSGTITWDMEPVDHPVMKDETGYITQMKSAYSPAIYSVVDDDPYASIIGHGRIIDGGQQVHSSCNLIAAWDDGHARMLHHGSYTSIIGYGSWPYGDIRRYCISSDKWLRKSGGLRSEGRCTYGYNNQVGQDNRTPAGDTILVMDYNDWRIDRDAVKPEKNDDDSYIALRHGGRANALLADGRVVALRLSDIKSGMWTPKPGD